MNLKNLVATPEAIVVTVFSAALAAIGQPYDAAGDFSTKNPSGAWTYGYSESRNTEFKLMTLIRPNEPPGLDVRGATDRGPWIIKNKTGAVANYATISHPADMLNLDPSHDGRNAALRWTAPVGASYRVRGRFEGLDSTTTDVAVIVAGKVAVEGVINGRGNQSAFEFVTNMIAQQTVDFSVGQGSGGSLFDSTGLKVTIDWVGDLPAMPPIGGVSYSTSAPIRTGQPWQFTATYSHEISDLRLRVQSTLSPNVESSWSDLPGGSRMSRLDATWTLDTVEVPPGNRYFRVLAAAPFYTDAVSAVIGPISVQEGISSFILSYGTTSPPRSGAVWRFQTFQQSLVADLRLRVQSSTTPSDESSWSDLPGNSSMTNRSGTWTVTTTTVPAGARYFRALASAAGYEDRRSQVLGPIDVAAPLPVVTQTFAGKSTVDLTTVPGLQERNLLLLKAQQQAAPYFVTNPARAHQIIASALLLVAEQNASATLAIDSGKTLTTPGVTIGPNSSLILGGTVDGSVSLIGLDAASLIGQSGGGLVGPDGGSVVGHNGGTLRDIQAGGILEPRIGSLISDDGSTLVGNSGNTYEGSGLVGNNSNGLVGNYGNTFAPLTSGDFAGLIGPDGASLVARDGVSLIGLDGGTFRPQSVGNNVSHRTARKAAVASFTGIMVVTGEYIQDAASGLALGIAGTNTLASGRQEFDQLVVGGIAQLSGVIGLDFFNAADPLSQSGKFQPAAGSTFDLVVANKVVPKNLILRGPIWGDGLFFKWAVVQRKDGKQALRVLSAPLPPPLATRVVGNKLELAWPTNYAGYNLQRTADFSAGNWAVVPAGASRVTIEIVKPFEFFRLAKP